MKRNMGYADRIIRSVLALAIISLYAKGYIPETIGIVLLIVAAIFLVTSLFAFCPLYRLINVSTCSNKKAGEVKEL
ncbi:MAG: DUF2892 domain-containing protein [Chitinophagaceae bacterium]|nr:MAG: DUF2892 domain-containing protein [Chitinophagaceae bacterium]